MRSRGYAPKLVRESRKLRRGQWQQTQQDDSSSALDVASRCSSAATVTPAAATAARPARTRSDATASDARAAPTSAPVAERDCTLTASNAFVLDGPTFPI